MANYNSEDIEGKLSVKYSVTGTEESVDNVYGILENNVYTFCAEHNVSYKGNLYHRKKKSAHKGKVIVEGTIDMVMEDQSAPIMELTEYIEGRCKELFDDYEVSNYSNYEYNFG